jgi:hypothetical protein
MSELLSPLINQVKKLGEIELQISAAGAYKDKRGTRVQDVAVYQNNGTKYIKPAQFVQRAEKRHRFWITRLQRAVGKWLSGDEREMTEVGRIMARNINRSVNRIDTRRLKTSFRHLIKKAK